MTKFLRTFVVLVCFAASTLCLSCLENFSQSSTFNLSANTAVGQFIHGSRLTDTTFTGAALSRADSNTISGTFYILPGEDINPSNAIWSTSFSSNTNTVYANGTVTLTPSSSYTFLWVRDSNGVFTSIYQAGDWLANSTGVYDTVFEDPDVSGQFCFTTPPSSSSSPSVSPSPSPSTTPSPSSSPSPSSTPSVTPSPSTTPSPSSTPSVTPSPSSTPSISPSPSPSPIYNRPPTHSIRGISATSANYYQINSVQQTFRINQGTNGVNLILYVNDTDLVGTSNNITFNATVNTLSSADGAGYAYLYLSSSETNLVDVTANSNSLIYLTGTLANIQAVVARISVRWTPLEIMTFRIVIQVYDHGNTGSCSNGVSPCPMWTMSRTEFRTSPTGV